MSNPVPELVQDYIGDGVYVSYQGFDIQISTPRSDGDHTVFLEPHVFAELVRFARRIGWTIEEPSNV